MFDLFVEPILEKCIDAFEGLNELSENGKIDAINRIRLELHKYSPMRNEPVDCVLWVKVENIEANDYNPNTIAPPEMKLLAHSISEDGYTQPIVTWKNDVHYEVVDGWHRHRVGKEISNIRNRIMGYLPITIINADRQDRGDRIAATIRHNRARGKHRIDAMSDIVIELKRRNWSDEKIGRDLGMDPDEVLRLTQITGLAEMFADREFSKAWESGESLEINLDDNLLPVEEMLDKDISPLQGMGGLEGRDVSRDSRATTSGGDRRSISTIEDSCITTIGDERSGKKMADSIGSESEQLGQKQASLVGTGGLLFEERDSGLPYETGMAWSNRMPAKICKRRSRFGNKGMGI